MLQNVTPYHYRSTGAWVETQWGAGTLPAHFALFFAGERFVSSLQSRQHSH